MAEKQIHKEVKAKAAGPSGKTEVPIKGGRRLDAATGGRAIEVETSGSPQRLRQAAQRLKGSGKGQHVLVVPQKDMPKAREAMTKTGVRGTVRNLSGTKKAHVAPRPSAGGTRKGGRTSSR
jgi:hypothetical protein